MKKIYIPIQVKLAIKLYALAIITFLIFRLTLFISQIDKLNDSSLSDVLYAFWMGIRFDLVISGYILIIPIFIISIASFFGKKCVVMEKIFIILLTILFSIAFIVCGADIFYFNQFFDRFNVNAFSWMKGDGGFSFVVGMIWESYYWLILIPIGLLVFGYYYCLKLIFEKTEKWEKGHLISKIVFSLLLIGFIFLGIRGRLDEKSPIRVGTAYFCNNAFLNQLGLNPNFTLIQSYIDSQNEKDIEYHFMDDIEALKNTQKYLSINSPNIDFPIARKIESNSKPNDYNVVLIIMESMSSGKMTRFGNKNNLTPFLDSLSYKGLFFDNCYTSGIHTYNGIFSSITSYPTVFKQNPMKKTPILKYNGIASTLKDNNYSTIFFIPHDSQFDNINGFVLANDYEGIISKSDYPFHEIKTTLGVPDDFMFRFSIPILNKMYQNNRPFFATFMTASDHAPYFIPDYFSSNNKNEKERIVEYADFSLKQFIYLAQQEPWFNNTIFVFVADHGYSNNVIYPIPINYIHTPLLFYAPNLIKDTTNSNLASQIDVFPTTMGLLNISYTNNTFGIDLQKEKREFVIATADDKYAVLNQDWLFIDNYNKLIPLSLYNYKLRETKDYSNEFPEIVQEMKTFGESIMQTSEYIMRTKKTNIKNDYQ